MLIVPLREVIDYFDVVGRRNADPIFPDGPSLPIVAQSLDRAIDYAEPAAREHSSDAIELREELLVGRRVQRAQENIGEIDLHTPRKPNEFISPRKNLGGTLKDLPEVYKVRHPEDHFVVRIGATMDEIKREAVIRTLDGSNGNQTRAAQILGISRHSLYDLLREDSRGPREGVRG